MPVLITIPIIICNSILGEWYKNRNLIGIRQQMSNKKFPYRELLEDYLRSGRDIQRIWFRLVSWIDSILAASNLRDERLNIRLIRNLWLHEYPSCLAVIGMLPVCLPTFGRSEISVIEAGPWYWKNRIWRVHGWNAILPPSNEYDADNQITRVEKTGCWILR